MPGQGSQKISLLTKPVSPEAIEGDPWINYGSVVHFRFYRWLHWRLCCTDGSTTVCWELLLAFPAACVWALV